MRLQLVILGFLVAMACPFVGYAQYDIVAGSIREEQTALNGDSARKQTFQISPRRVVHYKSYVATLIRDDETGLVWFAFEAANTQTTQPTLNWKVAKSKDGGSLVGFQADASILTFRVSRRTAGSMDSARSLAMTELSAEIGAFEANLAISSPEVDLNPHLDLSSFSGASGLGQRDIRRVPATVDGWLVELASHPTLAKTAFVYLSQDFKVLKVEVRNN